MTAVVSDNPPTSIQVLEASSLERSLGGARDFVLKLDVTKVEVDKLRYEVADNKLNIYLTPFKGSFAPSDVTFGYGEANIKYDLTIALGVPTRARIDRIYDQNAASFEAIPLVNLDFHRSNENYGAVNLIEPNASSLCEMLVALSESLQSGIIDGEIATALLMGIVASTDRFTAAHTSPKSLTVAAQMMAAGARQQAVIKALYRDGKAEAKGAERSGGSDRGDRNDRGDRPDRGDRNDNRDKPAEDRTNVRNDRPERSDRGAERTSGSDRNTSQPPAAQNRPQPQPAQPRREETFTDTDVPIIAPAHIEMSAPEPAPVEPPKATPTQPAQGVPQTATEPQANQNQPAARPQAMPIADFAAAAEMFNRQPAASEIRPERDAS